MTPYKKVVSFNICQAQEGLWSAHQVNNCYDSKVYTFRNPNFLLYSTSIALVISGKFMVNPFIKDFAVKNVGLEKYQPAMILSICSGIGEFFFEIQKFSK